MATLHQRRQAVWKRTDKRAVQHQRAIAERVGLIIMRAADATNQDGDRAIAPVRVKIDQVQSQIWNAVLKPYFIGPTDEPLTGPRPNSPYSELVVDGIEEAILLEAEQQVRLTRRLLRTKAPDLAAYLIEGEEPREAVLPALVTRPFGPSDFRDADGKIDPEAARKAFVRPRGTYDPFHRFVDSGGYRLSDRIWRSGLSERRAIDGFMDYHISRGTSAVSMAEQLEGYLTATGAATRTPKPYGTNGSYAARRLARTEITAAGGRSTIAMSEANPFVGGVKWVLSPAHRDVDQCDANAKGGPNGDGVYTPSTVPTYPDHPHDMCTLTPVPAGNVDDVVKDMRKKIRKARNELSYAVGGRDDIPAVRKFKRLLDPVVLARAAQSGELNTTISNIVGTFQKARVHPIKPKGPPKPKPTDPFDDLDFGDLVTPKPKPKPKPAPKPKTTKPAVIKPVPTGSAIEQIPVIEKNISNMRREKGQLLKELTDASPTRVMDIVERVKALDTALKTQTGFLSEARERLAPKPKPKPQAPPAPTGIVYTDSITAEYEATIKRAEKRAKAARKGSISYELNRKSARETKKLLKERLAALELHEGHIPIGYLNDADEFKSTTVQARTEAKLLTVQRDKPEYTKFLRVIKKAVDQINDVHAAPKAMDKIKLRIVSGKTEHGRYDPRLATVTVNLDNSGQAAHNRTTVWHEMGHAFDDQMIGSSGWALNNGKTLVASKQTFQAPHARRALTELRDAFADNQRVKDWKEAARTGKFRKKAVSKDYMEYIARDEEIFARAYAQYVAGRTVDIPALQALNKEGKSRQWGFGQWTDDNEFDDIFDAFDKLFGAMGVLRD